MYLTNDERYWSEAFVSEVIRLCTNNSVSALPPRLKAKNSMLKVDNESYAEICDFYI